MSDDTDLDPITDPIDTTHVPKESERPFRPYGSAVDMWGSHAPVVLLAGPAGTGKTRANLEKVVHCCTKYPGARWLILRKTRKSLTETALVTLEEMVLPAAHPALRGPKRNQRSSYHFPNGSTIALAGCDDPQKLYSSEYDGIYIPEANELDEDEVEKLFRAMRWPVMPYKQILMDCNPQGPGHWLKKWGEAGRLQFLDTKHQDNPRYYDHWAQRWTPEGEKYLATLDRLTGVRLQRLRYGKWVQAEGMVYEGWTPSVHLLPQFPIPKDWARFKSVDFGYTNPFVCGWWAEDGDGRLYLYREIYMTGKLVEDHARQIKEIDRMNNEPLARAIICDHDAEDRATLERHLGRATTPAKKSVSPGIQAVQSRLKVQPDGRPRLFILRDSLVQRDGDLADAKKPLCTAEEFEGYVWDEKADVKKEVPVKENDHGMDMLRYLIFWRDDRIDYSAINQGKPLAPDGGSNVVEKAAPSTFETPKRSIEETLKRKW